MDPTVLAADLPVHMGGISVNELLTKAALLMVIVERAVAQYKAIRKTDLSVKPWPLVSLLIAGVIVFRYQFFLLEALLGHGPTGGADIPPVVDFLVSTGTLAGGSAGIIDTIKALRRRSEQAAKASIAT